MALERAALLPADRLTRLQRLRRDYSASQAAGIVALLELRARARTKFANADQMFFTPEGLEQSTGETIAAYRAARFPAAVPVLDACCGVGGDALALRQRGRVVAVDQNPAAAACARANAAVVTPAGNAEVNVLCADVTRLDLARLRRQGVRGAFFDPSRRMDAAQGRARARNAEDYLPPLSWLDALAAHFPFVGVKVSPAIDDEALAQVGAQVEFIAEGNECKEAMLWRVAEDGSAQGSHTADGGADGGSAQSSGAKSGYRATIVRRGMPPVTLWPGKDAYLSPVAPGAWLYEPNPAVIRAHLVTQAALILDAAPIDSQTAYLSGNTHTVSPFATAYRVLDWMPYHAKNLSAWLRTHHRRVEVVKKRGVLLEPDAVRKTLFSPALASNAPLVLLLMRRGEQIIAILCDPPAVGSWGL